MRIGVLGINHKSSELSFREMLSKACVRQFSKESKIAQKLSCVVLSTCNRTEIYFSSETLAEAHTAILSVLREEISEAFEHKLYTYFGCDCFFHLAAVTAGLDSVILGETEIQRQVKLAYQTTSLYYRLPSSIHFLFQKSLKIAKSIRTTAQITCKQQTLPAAIFQISQWFFEDLKQKRILFIGNSEINRKVISHFKHNKCDQLTLMTRAVHSAQEVGSAFNLSICNWSELNTWKDYDMVICGTTHPDFILGPEHLESQPLKTKLIFDLSVPRTVDPDLNKNSQLTLFNIEELGKLIDQRKVSDIDEISHIESIIWNQVQKQIEIFYRRASFISSQRGGAMCLDS